MQLRKNEELRLKGLKEAREKGSITYKDRIAALEKVI